MITVRPPELISLGPVELYTYAVCILVGIVGGYYLCRGAGRRAGITAEDLQVSLLYGILPGIVGARLYHVFDQHAYYLANPGEIVAIWQGGLAILGGLLGGLIGLWVFARRKGIRLLTVLDVWAPGVLLAQAIGRIGNWANQEAFGPPSNAPWAVPIDPAHRPAEYLAAESFHPTFLYELTWDTVGLIALLAFRRQLELTPGRVLGAYLMIYGSGRFLVEYFRIDTAAVAGIPIAQLVAVGMVTLGAYLLLRSSDRGRQGRS